MANTNFPKLQFSHASLDLSLATKTISCFPRNGMFISLIFNKMPVKYPTLNNHGLSVVSTDKNVVPWEKQLSQFSVHPHAFSSSRQPSDCAMQRECWGTDQYRSVQFSSVAQLCPTLRPHELQHTRTPCPSPTPGVYLNSCPSSRWCHPAILSSVVPFSSCLQSLPESGSFPMSQLFSWGGQSIGVSASASVLPMNTQDWFPLGWTGWISLQSKGLSRVFSNTTVQKHQFFST